MGKRLALVGRQFFGLLVIDAAPSGPDGKARYVCRCTCGRTTIVRGDNLVSGRSATCGARECDRNRAGWRLG